MSLLIKALEQAAKDRDSIKPAAASTSAAVPGAAPEPTLEPPPPPRSRPADAAASPAVNPTAHVSARSTAQLTLDTASPRRAAPAAALAEIDAQQQRARAAAVVQAAGQSGPVFMSYFRGNPVMWFGACAALFAAGFGLYVYLQIMQPDLFVRQAPQSGPGMPQPGASTAPQTTPSAAVTPPAPAPTLSSASAGDANGVSSRTASNAPPITPSQIAGSISSSVPTIGGGPISTASIIGSAGAAEEKLPTQAQRESSTRADQNLSKPRTSGASAGPAPSKEPISSGRERIAVSSTTTQPRVDPILTQAYAALQSGNLDEARAAYSKLSQNEPLSTDALLGLAYIAAQENRSDDAMKLYLRILQVNPRHAAAQAALIGLMGRADPIASETRLKQLISREPSAFLHFVLGNLYADQSLWAQAQQAYFQAHHLEPDNPDYAYNLAVGLDHLRQTKLALGFYRRAEQLAAGNARSNFNLTHARERISVLSSQLE